MFSSSDFSKNQGQKNGQAIKGQAMSFTSESVDSTNTTIAVTPTTTAATTSTTTGHFQIRTKLRPISENRA